VITYQKPAARTAQAITRPGDSDDFDGPALGPQWQWNANPQPDWASLSAVPGSLRLKAISSPANLWNTGAMLTQKLPGPRFTATTQLRFAPQAVGERAGLVMFGRSYGWVGLEKTAAGLRLVQVTRENADHDGPEHVEAILAAAPANVWLRLAAEPVTQPAPPPEFTPYSPSMLRNQNAAVQFSYSLDGMRFEPVGKGFVARQGQWVGAQMGLFAQAPSESPAYSAYRVGWADFSSFDVTR
jgi:beta-xylosidase